VRELRWLREWSKGTTAPFVFGCIALAVLTLIGALFDVQHGAAALLYLIAVVVAALWDVSFRPCWSSFSRCWA